MFFRINYNIKKNSKHNVIYVTSDLEDLDPIDNDLRPIFIGDNIFRTIFFTTLSCNVMIMSLTDLGNHHLKKSKNCKNYIYIFHSFVSTHKCYAKKAFFEKRFDLVTPNRTFYFMVILFFIII